MSDLVELLKIDILEATNSGRRANTLFMIKMYPGNAFSK